MLHEDDTNGQFKEVAWLYQPNQEQLFIPAKDNIDRTSASVTCLFPQARLMWATFFNKPVKTRYTVMMSCSVYLGKDEEATLHKCNSSKVKFDIKSFLQNKISTKFGQI